MTNTTNAVEKPATGCGCGAGLCPIAKGLHDKVLEARERYQKMARGGRRAAWTEYLKAVHAYQKHVEASNG